MECYSTIKGNELSSYTKTLRNLKCILLSKRNQSEKTELFIQPAKVKTKKMINIFKISSMKKVNSENKVLYKILFHLY